jgi:signal transduction histidine kinase
MPTTPQPDPEVDLIALNYAIRLILSDMSREHFLEEVMEALFDFGKTAHVCLYTKTSSADDYGFEAGIRDGHFRQWSPSRMPTWSELGFTTELRQPQCFAIETVAGWLLPAPSKTLDETGHCMVVPLLGSDNHTRGFLFFGYHGSYYLTSGLLQPLRILASVIGLALETRALMEAQQQEAEQRLQLSLLEAEVRHAETVARQKASFLATMSHEIRSPLGIVIGAAELLDETELSPEQARYAQIISRTGSHLGQLVNEVLDLSKLDAGGYELNVTPFELRRLLEDVGSGFSIPCQERNNQLIVDVDPALPAWVLGDAARLKQVLYNLINNANKFTENGRITMGAYTRGGLLEFSVTDTGIGIAADQQHLVFDEFKQVRTQHENDTPGTGLGLAISQKIVHLMDGIISLQSQPGTGTTFWFQLPLKAAEPPAKSNPDATRSVKIGKPSDARTRILIADDAAESRIILQAYLRSAGVHVVEAKDGTEAIEQLGQQRFAMVLTDLNMPGMDGYQFARKIRQRGLSIPIIAVTGSVTAEEKVRAAAAGFTELIEKPIQREALLRIVTRHLGL